jgi:hypothetical protein
MFSGGQVLTSQQAQYYDAYGRPVTVPNAGQQVQGYGSATMGLPMVQMLPQPGGMNLNLKSDLDPKDAKALADNQQEMGKWTTLINAGIGLLNGITSWVALGLQNEQMGRYYDYMNRVADDSREIALAQINLQSEAMDHESAMMEEKSRHEQELARIEQRTQIRLAKIAEKGKTDRAGIYAANNAFARDYSYGSPVC